MIHRLLAATAKKACKPTGILPSGKKGSRDFVSLIPSIRSMTKRLYILLFFCCFAIAGKAQFDTSFAKKNIRICADSLSYGFRYRNWEVFARYSNPSMIGMIGGKEAFIQYVANSFTGVPDSAFKVYKTGEILQVIKTNADLQALIELHSVVEWQGRRITTVSILIGQSWDGGLFWTFFDSQNDATMSKAIKPNLSNDLIIPARNEKAEPIKPNATSGSPKGN
jgi:hypothetical protein